MQKKSLKVVFMQWLPLAAAILIISGLAYAAVQQDLRQTANDPQIQVAEDITAALNKGLASPDSIVPPNPTADIASSLSAFVIIYDSSGKPLGGSVALDGKLPTPPSGVFDKAKKSGENRLTWQPKAGVRVAAVVTTYSGTQSGYVLAGRLLREVEKREKTTMYMSGLAALLALVLTFLLMLLVPQKIQDAGATEKESPKEIKAEKVEIDIK